MGLYSAFGGNAYAHSDPYGLSDAWGWALGEAFARARFQEQAQLEMELSYLPTSSGVVINVVHATQAFDRSLSAKSGIVNVINFLHGKGLSVFHIEHTTEKTNLFDFKEGIIEYYAPRKVGDEIIKSYSGGILHAYEYELGVSGNYFATSEEKAEALLQYARKEGFVSPINTYISLGGYTDQCFTFNIVDLASIGILSQKDEEGNWPEKIMDVNIFVPARASFYNLGLAGTSFEIENFAKVLASHPLAKTYVQDTMEKMRERMKIYGLEPEIAFETVSGRIKRKLNARKTPTVYITIID